MTKSTTTFQDRLRAAVGEDGYRPFKRRSIQTAILYETHRSLKDKLLALRPFQKKIAAFVQFHRILNEDCSALLMPHQRIQILWKTATNKQPLTAEAILGRMRLAVKEVEAVAEEVQSYILLREEDEREKEEVFVEKTHEEVYAAFLRKRFVSPGTIVASLRPTIEWSNVSPHMSTFSSTDPLPALHSVTNTGGNYCLRKNRMGHRRPATVRVQPQSQPRRIQNVLQQGRDLLLLPPPGQPGH
jgi:hypothetical protein